MESGSVLACDIGNTRMAFAQVIGEDVTNVHRFTVDQSPSLAAMLQEVWEGLPEPRKVVASSVNPKHLEAVEAAVGEALGESVIVIGRDIPPPITTDLPEPARIGTDRLCSAAMAFARLQQACAVATFGTAITIDCVSQDGMFLGGAILPGLRASARALAQWTAALPEVELVKPDWVYGRNTREAIVGGIVIGARGALRELVEKYATELGQWPPLILTGGDAELVGEGYDIVQAIVPELCLMGVGLAWELARPESQE
jgi:type III pantothenate kinase